MHSVNVNGLEKEQVDHGFNLFLSSRQINHGSTTPDYRLPPQHLFHTGPGPHRLGLLRQRAGLLLHAGVGRRQPSGPRGLDGRRVQDREVIRSCVFPLDGVRSEFRVHVS